MELEELDKIWTGQNLDEKIMKKLCRRYSPWTMMQWIARGLTIESKDKYVEWLRKEMKQMGEEIITMDEKKIEEGDYGDYFSD